MRTEITTINVDRKENTIKNIEEDDESVKFKPKLEYVFCIDIANEISCKIGGVDVVTVVFFSHPTSAILTKVVKAN